MNKVIIGVDPDSDKHGIAQYIDGKLTGLYSFRLMQIPSLIDCARSNGCKIEFHIENVCANNSTFRKKGVKNAKANQAVTRGIGKCQQAQIELERLLGYYDVKVFHHKISKIWKSAQTGKKQFEKITGWNKRSNEDTRSAAYFGWLGTQSK